MRSTTKLVTVLQDKSKSPSDSKKKKPRKEKKKGENLEDVQASTTDPNTSKDK